MKQINLAVLGFGNVGRAFCRYIEKTGESEHGKINIRVVADSSGTLLIQSPEQLAGLLTFKEAGGSLREFAPAESIIDAQRFIKACRLENIHCLVESLPTNVTDGQPALDLLGEALSQGINVVTADKGPLVHGFEALKKAAESGASRFAFTGTTGVAIPPEIRENKVLGIRGVLNGTSNFILTAMQQQGLSFDEALAIAQRDGIAEPDPSLDVAGWDTACKILILANALMNANARLPEVSRIGIGEETQRLIEVARATNRIVRLVGRARIWQGRVRVSVAPKLLDKDSPFYAVNGTSKAAVFRTAEQGEVLTFARSGRDAISQVMLDDVLKVLAESLSASEGSGGVE
jgi:homoserine dehydrogenase